MRYDNIVSGTFLSRPNRFIAHVETGGEAAVCHVKNTGRCRELLIPGGLVYLQDFGPEPAGRKTRYDLIAVKKERPSGPLLINMDAQAPNKVFAQWARTGKFRPDLTPPAAGDGIRRVPVRFLLRDGGGHPGLCGGQGRHPGGE